MFLPSTCIKKIIITFKDIMFKNSQYNISSIQVPNIYIYTKKKNKFVNTAVSIVYNGGIQVLIERTPHWILHNTRT